MSRAPEVPAKLLPTLRCLNKGTADAAIATELGFTLGTVRAYVDQLKTHLGTRDRFELVRRARQRGIVPTPRVDRARAATLTALERHYLQAAYDGIDIGDLAHLLTVPTTKVAAARASIYRKLGVRSEADALRFARAAGIVARADPATASPAVDPIDRKILRGLARGRSQTEVARAVGLSSARISSRLSALRAAMRAPDLYALLEVARERGVLPPATKLPQRPDPDGLRPSYYAVLELMNRGIAYDSIAEKLDLDITTVWTYAAKLYAHFGVDSLQDLISVARERSLVPDVAADPSVRDRVFEPRLSGRQREALELARLDIGPAEMARMWRTSASNAEDAIQMARRKLEAPTTEAAVARAIEIGFVEPLPATTRVPFPERELEVLDLLARGYTRREIGRELGIGRLTAGGYILSMRAKVRARDDDELLTVAERLGAIGRARRVRRDRAREVRRRGPIGLTARQAEVAEAMMRWPNLSHRVLAERLGITAGTFNQHAIKVKHCLNLTKTSREEFAERYRAMRRP